MVKTAEVIEKLDGMAISAEVSSTMHLEVRLKKGASKCEVEKCKELIAECAASAENLYNWRSFVVDHPELERAIDQVLVGCSNTPDGQRITFGKDSTIPTANVHIYNVRDGDVMATNVSAGDGDDTTTIAAHHWELPNKEFDDLWENLVFDDNIKNDLLSFVYALLKLSDRGANSNVLSVNRMVLLHGPPGTGKTSLCKALAQRLSIRLSGRYRRAVFIEVNSHSVFSKWFAESGKLIMKLFEQIEECASDPHQLVFVLIDEVESLTLGRASSFKGNDPSDALRSVNAVLTQMDKIRRYRNCLVLTTSNITEALDEAFVDRADINRYVGTPSAYAIYSILSSTIKELQRIELVAAEPVLDPVSAYKAFNAASQRLLTLCSACVGFSGRTIRKLPVLAYSRLATDKLTMDQFLNLLELAIIDKRTAENKADGEKHLEALAPILHQSRAVSGMESQCEFKIALCIYGQVSFEPWFKLLIDTEPMQRLRRVMQLGFCTYVWPDATHTRFVHSLGTAYLARKIIQSLRANGYPVPQNHEFGVIVAAMLHDLGHGPFSHSFETVANELLRESGYDRKFRHEDMSIKLFNYILENYPDVADMIRDHLGDKLNTEFIEALIDPPENLFDENNHIIIKGLENKDAYLFSIVSNKHCGLDVDKIDYIVRDSLMTNVNVSVNADRIITGVHAEEFSPEDGEPKRTCLVFDKKIMSDIRDMFQARIKLHEICYNHKTVMITEYLYSKAMKLALPYLSFKNAKGDVLNFFDALFDPSAFLRMDDSVISKITNHLEPNEDLLRAECIIHQAECRNHPRIVSRVFLDTLVDCRQDGRPVRSLKQLQADLQEQVRPFDGIVLTKSVDAGKGVGVNPMFKVLVKPRNGTKVKYSDKVLPLTDMGYVINVYCPLSESPPAEEIHESVRDFFAADIEVSFEQRA